MGFRASCTPLPAYTAKPPPSQPEPWPTQPVSWRIYANEPGKQNNPEGGRRVKKIFWNLWFLDSHHAEGPDVHFPGLRDDRGDQGMAGSSGVYRTFVTILWEEARGTRGLSLGLGAHPVPSSGLSSRQAFLPRTCCVILGKSLVFLSLNFLIHTKG